MNVAVVDLRYPSGFALRPIASAEPTGKQDSKREVMSKEYKELIVGPTSAPRKITCVVAELKSDGMDGGDRAGLAAVVGLEEGRRGEHRGHRGRDSGSSRKSS